VEPRSGRIDKNLSIAPMTNATYHRFDTQAVDIPSRFEYWRAWCAQAIDVPMQMEPVGRAADAFDAVAEALTVGSINFVEHRSGPVIGGWSRGGTEAAGRLRLMITAPTPGSTAFCHGHRFPLDGGAAALVGQSDGGWQTTKGLHGIQVNVPYQAVPLTEKQLLAFNDQRRLLRDPTFTGLVRPALVGLSGHLDTLSTTDLSELPALWISLLTMLARSLADRDLDGFDTAPARRLQARRYIEANLADPRLSPTTIAAALHVSRSTLYAAFSDTDGIAGEIRRRRLHRARTALCDPSNATSIAEIARSVGIPNATQFSRAFNQRYGVPPRQLRADHRTRKE